MSQSKWSSRRNTVLLRGGLVLFRPLTDWVRPTNIGEDNLHYSVYWFRCECHLKTPSQKQNSVWPNIWAPLGPIMLTYKIDHHRRLVFSQNRGSFVLTQNSYWRGKKWTWIVTAMESINYSNSGLTSIILLIPLFPESPIIQDAQTQCLPCLLQQWIKCLLRPLSLLLHAYLGVLLPISLHNKNFYTSATSIFPNYPHNLPLIKNRQ